MLVIGLTGGIGSGKSAASSAFAALGARVLSADALAARITESTPSLLRALRRKFGPGIFSSDGILDRRKLAAIVFRSPSRLAALNRLVHPVVIAQIRHEIAAFRARPGVMIIESALIYEAGLEKLFDYVVVVDSPRESRITRVMRRDHVSRADVVRRMRAQHSGARALREADIILANDGSRRKFLEACGRLYRLLRRMDRHSPERRHGNSH